MRTIVGVTVWVLSPTVTFGGECLLLGLEVGAFLHESEGLGLQRNPIGLNLERPVPVGFGAGHGGASQLVLTDVGVGACSAAERVWLERWVPATVYSVASPVGVEGGVIEHRRRN